MSEEVAKTFDQYVLPPSVVSRLDVSRVLTEAEKVDNELTSAAVRTKAGSSEQSNPTVSDVFADFLKTNQLSFSDSQSRSHVIRQLRQLKDRVPVIHMTFAVEADRESLGQIVAWLRSEIHPQAVIAVGMQPALVAGVYMRTPNHVHDLSLRAKLEGSRELLVKEMEALRG